MSTLPQKGLRFYHRRVLDSMKFDGHSRQLFVVTRIAAGVVYYRPVIDYGTREVLGCGTRCQLSDWGNGGLGDPFGTEAEGRTA